MTVTKNSQSELDFRAHVQMVLDDYEAGNSSELPAFVSQAYERKQTVFRTVEDWLQSRKEKGVSAEVIEWPAPQPRPSPKRRRPMNHAA